MRKLQLLGLLALAPAGLAAQVPEKQPAPSPVAPDTAADTTAAPRAAAVEPTADERGARWRTSYFPYLAGGANDSPVLSFRVRHWQPAEYESRSTYTAAVNGDAGIAPKGSRFIAGSFRAPGLWKDWRLALLALAGRQVRYGYYGLGNETVSDPDNVTEENPFFYRMRRQRYWVAGEVTRRIHGPFHAALLTQYEHAKFTSLPGQSVFSIQVPSGELEQDNVAGRLALIYDTRDNEFNTHQGLLLEAGSEVGSANDGYSRQYAILRGYLQVREGTVLAARIAGSGTGGSPSLNAVFELPGWEHPVPVLGGQYSHRGLDYGRFTGRGTLFGNFEVRHDLLPFGDLGAVTLLGFLDVGRVFEGEDFRLTTEGMKVGGGGGFAIRVLRSSILTFNFAGGPDGFQFSLGNGWMF
jgi:hypothetical protein